MRSDLIYDIGSHNGDDTAYYLHKGFQVLAVEANPVLAAHAQRRFGEEIAQGRLTVLNIGITQTEGTFSFWINEVQDTWSSFDRSIAGFDGSPCREVKVACLPLSALLKKFGVPYYLKVDIEGYDHLCIQELDPNHLPRYISLELLLHGTDKNNILDKLCAVGYRKFKVINQATYTISTPIFDREIILRILRKACVKFPALKRLVYRLPDTLRPKKYDFDSFPNTLGYTFPPGASGPFGEASYGAWHNREQTERLVERIRRTFLRANALESCWYDVHATF